MYKVMSLYKPGHHLSSFGFSILDKYSLLFNQASLGCEICEFLIDTADQYLQSNKSEAAINATIYKLCNDLPDTFQSFVSVQVSIWILNLKDKYNVAIAKALSSQMIS